MDAAEVREELETLGPEGFVERYGRWFLVLTEPEALDDFASFVNTASRAAHEITTRGPLDTVDVRPLQPRKPGAAITIGRENADISLGHRKVSKHHATFTTGGGLLSLTDVGSKNGTWLNGKLVKPHEPVPVDVGDTLHFGSVAATIWGLEDLRAAIK